MLHLEVQVVNFYFGADLDFLDDRPRLRFPRFPLPFPLFIKEFAVIHYPTYRRVRRSRHLDEVEAFFFGAAQGFVDGNDADLISVFVNQSDFGGADAAVNTGALFYDTLSSLGKG